MANSPQAKKRARQNQIRSLHNASQRSEVRTAIKNTLKSIKSNDKSAAETAFRRAVILIDRAAGRRIMHHNKAARLKSRLHKKLKESA
ncbi:30S ribosomal protein S20 [Candidiatus Paracoxiella cheracis]|uniref:30S ribosomal protein S20 n=1 Tax=Candidiatus Paracoxiella cheracis TaxID=3405120 RepID=UPI003BF4B9EE